MNILAGWHLNNNISPGSIAVLQKNQSFTYSELENKINSAAQIFISRGIKEGNFTAILLDNNLDFIISIFALWKIGAIPVPVNTRLINNEIESILGIISTNQRIFIITDETYKNKFGFIADIINIDSYNNKAEVVLVLANSFSIQPVDSTAVIIFTSGSSGLPKGVKLTFNNLIQSAVTGNQFLKHTKDDRWLAALPFYHIGGFSIFVRTFLSGASVILPDTLSKDDIAASLYELKPTLTSFVSTQLKRLIENNIKPNIELRNILLGGGFVDNELVELALQNGWNISKVYGSSETASFVTAFDCRITDKINSAGRALPPNEIKIINDEGEFLPAGEPGEILVKGASVADGYLNDPGETLRKFKDGYYYTGDIGYLDNDGYLFVLARRTDLIISGGENINPVEVETAILKHPQISEAAVFAVKDKEWGQTAAAAIVTKNQNQITINELREFLKEKIAGYKIPRKIFVVDELPKTALGKVQREKLKELIRTTER